MDFNTLQRTGKPNDYLVADAEYTIAKPDRASPVLNKSAPAIADVILMAVKAFPRVALVSRDESNHSLHFIEKSRLMGFVDDIYLKCVPLEGQNSTRVLYYSKSRVGYSDMGVNRRRGELWLKTLATMAI